MTATSTDSTTMMTNPDDRRGTYYPKAFVETGALGCEHGTAYKMLTLLRTL